MIAARTGEALPLYRLYLLRALYALIAFAQGAQTWPAMIRHLHHWDMWHGVAMSCLGALTALALLGIKYPVRMLPLLLFEFAWKLLWVLAVWLPLWVGNRVDPDNADVAFSIFLGVVLVPIVLPWGYVWRNFVAAPGDRWK